MMTSLIPAEADFRIAKVKRSGRNQNESRIRQAVRGIKEMFKKDGQG